MVSTSSIAKELGVSRQVVSKVLLGGQANVRVSSSKARLIRHTAERMGFRPNVAAQAVATGRFNAAGLLYIADFGSPGQFGLVYGLDSDLHAHNMHLTMARTSLAELRGDSSVPKLIREFMVDGVVIAGEYPDELVQLLRSHRVPTVAANLRRDCDCVYPDDENAAAEATRRLLDLGHRRIALMVHGCESDHYSVRDRRAGYEAAMRAAGLTPMSWIAGREVPGEQRVALAMSALAPDRADRPTAVLAYEWDVAIPLLLAAATHGLRVPRDLSVVAFHDNPMAWHGVSVATMKISTHKVGAEAGAMLRHKIDHPDMRCEPRTIAHEWVEGDSLAPPPDQNA